MVALGRRELRSELTILWRRRQLTPRTLYRSWRAVTGVQALSKPLREASQRHGGFDLFYCYWSTFETYACILTAAKDSAGRAAVASRAHRYDLYDPALKHQSLHRMTKVFAVSRQGRDYLQAEYRLDDRHAAWAPLGVKVPSQMTPPTPGEELHIVTVSACVPVKRLDRVVAGLKILSDQGLPGSRVRWSHIGSGPLLTRLRRVADEQFPKGGSVDVRFLGALPHAEVERFLLSTPIDFIVNTSVIEGVPVSLMEAMAVGIPALATDVGGVRELVDEPHGRLLSSDPDPEEVARAIAEFAWVAKQPETRRAAQEVVAERYNAAINFPRFVTEMTAL